jgi:hypothetical protein
MFHILYIIFLPIKLSLEDSNYCIIIITTDSKGILTNKSHFIKKQLKPNHFIIEMDKTSYFFNYQVSTVNNSNETLIIKWRCSGLGLLPIN